MEHKLSKNLLLKFALGLTSKKEELYVVECLKNNVTAMQELEDCERLILNKCNGVCPKESMKMSIVKRKLHEHGLINSNN